MLEIASILDKHQAVKSPRSERAYIVKQFVEKLKAERGDKNYYVKDGKRIPLSPISDRMVAIRLSHLTIPDLYYTYSICKDATSFSKMFFFLTKTKTLA